MHIETSNTLIDSILTPWQACIGADYLGYRGHVYRMFHFCLALRPTSEDDKTKLAIAAAFHDIGLWSAHTTDYIPPSEREVNTWLAANGRQHWQEEIDLMIRFHHKLRPFPEDRFPLVELFRKGDLVDFSAGVFKCGLPAADVRAVQAAFPNHGFHRFLLKGAREWFAQHPFSPPPFLTW